MEEEAEWEGYRSDSSVEEGIIRQEVWEVREAEGAGKARQEMEMERAERVMRTGAEKGEVQLRTPESTPKIGIPFGLGW